MISLSALIDHLGRLPLAQAQDDSLRAAAQDLQAAVQASLSTPPGGSHATPWMRTGALHDSISATIDANTAVIGSDDPVAMDQELGTAHVPPRPFLAPAAAALGEACARRIGAGIAAILQPGRGA